METPSPVGEPSLLHMRLDRTAIVVKTVTGATSDAAYWHQRTPAERMEHLEQLRRLNDGDAVSGQLQRVLEVVRRPWG